MNLFGNKVYYYKDYELYADDGFIHVISKNDKDRDNPIHHISIDSWKQRILGIMALGKDTDGSDESNMRQLHEDTQAALEVMIAVMKDAVEQGDPLDPKVAYDRLQELKSTKKYTMKPNRMIANGCNK